MNGYIIALVRKFRKRFFVFSALHSFLINFCAKRKNRLAVTAVSVRSLGLMEAETGYLRSGQGEGNGLGRGIRTGLL